MPRSDRLEHTLPLSVHTWTRWSVGGLVMNAGATMTVASLTNPSANMAKYMPFWLPWPYPVRRVFWVNGSSITSANCDFGIYTAAGVRIYSTTSTAMSGPSVPQFVTPTPFWLPAGCYYFGFSASSTTANRGGSGATTLSTSRERMFGVLQEANALPLPNPMTPVSVANSYIVLCGITRTTGTLT